MNTEKKHVFEFSKKSKMYKQIRPNTYVKDDETWGNPIKEKQEECTRICMENINNL